MEKHDRQNIFIFQPKSRILGHCHSLSTAVHSVSSRPSPRELFIVYTNQRRHHVPTAQYTLSPITSRLPTDQRRPHPLPTLAGSAPPRAIGACGSPDRLPSPARRAAAAAGTIPWGQRRTGQRSVVIRQWLGSGVAESGGGSVRRKRAAQRPCRRRAILFREMTSA